MLRVIAAARKMSVDHTGRGDFSLDGALGAADLTYRLCLRLRNRGQVCDRGQVCAWVGLDHFEGRSWTGLHHHTLMTMIAFGFLLKVRTNQNIQKA
jgi:SRSO17 transposase